MRIEATMSARAYRFGGAAALVLAGLSAAAAVLYVLLPAEQRLGVAGRLLLPSFAANPVPLQLEMLALTAMGIVGLAVVGPIRALGGEDDPWLRWTSILAMVGYAVGAVGNSLVMGKLPGIATAFVGADDAAKGTIAVFWRTTLDPFGLWQFGAVGAWLLVVGIVALRDAGLPRVGVYLAIAAGVAHLAIPITLVAAAQPALTVLALVAAVVIVAWFGWVGMHLWRRGNPTTAV
jgi:hypothetical protein